MDLDFIEYAQRLEADGFEAESLDNIYDNIEELLQQKDFKKINTILAELSIEELSTDLLLALLITTLPAHNKLTYRDIFFNQITAIFYKRREDDALLAGLEG